VNHKHFIHDEIIVECDADAESIAASKEKFQAYIRAGPTAAAFSGGGFTYARHLGDVHPVEHADAVHTTVRHVVHPLRVFVHCIRNESSTGEAICLECARHLEAYIRSTPAPAVDWRPDVTIPEDFYAK
jgi:hypothetical protein